MTIVWRYTGHSHSLEHGDNRVKAEALKNIIRMVLNGERLPSLLMTIIRFVLPSNDHTLKKLLLIFWEIWPKTSGDGKLLHEMILVCDAYRKVSWSPQPHKSTMHLLSFFRICSILMSSFAAQLFVFCAN